jgi:hypothetical protein
MDTCVNTGFDEAAGFVEASLYMPPPFDEALFDVMMTSVIAGDEA